MESVGLVKVYACQSCNGRLVTVNADEGVTPFMIRCRSRAECRGDAVATFHLVLQDSEATYEWYRPQEATIRKLDSGFLGHVGRGGLLLRRRILAETRMIPYVC